MELRINRVRINRSRPVHISWQYFVLNRNAELFNDISFNNMSHLSHLTLIKYQIKPHLVLSAVGQLALVDSRGRYWRAPRSNFFHSQAVLGTYLVEIWAGLWSCLPGRPIWEILYPSLVRAIFTTRKRSIKETHWSGQYASYWNAFLWFLFTVACSTFRNG